MIKVISKDVHIVRLMMVVDMGASRVEKEKKIQGLQEQYPVEAMLKRMVYGRPTNIDSILQIDLTDAKT